MEIGAMLDELREKALKDRNIWQELMDTRKAEQPLAAFCAKCRELDRKSTRLNSSHRSLSRMPSSA